MDRLYPRPSLVRSDWVNLNGQWDFDFDDQNVGIKDKWYTNHTYTKKIIVPYGYQTQNSGIHDLSIHDRVWYRRKFHIRKDSKRVILHFEAVDYEAHIYINQKLVYKHIGGYTRFSVDITDHIKELENDLVVMAYDPSLDAKIVRGKQTKNPEPYECYYDRTTGIWQTVWLEFIDASAIKDIKITPNIDTKQVTIDLTSYDASPKVGLIKVLFDGQLVKEKKVTCLEHGKVTFEFNDEVMLWSPEMPNLYDVEVEMLQNNKVIDKFISYFGMRKISILGNQILLNNEPYYLRMVLDQGYYKEGLITYTSEKDLENDIVLAKAMGFNGARKHQKIEAQRWLYYADKLGYLVSLEMPSQYEYQADNRFIKEWVDAIHRDYNHPSLCMYIPFNESWGVKELNSSIDQQNYVKGLFYLTKSLDPSRIVISNDGWEQPVSEVCTIHSYNHGKIDDDKLHALYFSSLNDLDVLLSSQHTNGQKPIYVGGLTYQGEPILFSEFGGISYANKAQLGWGYTGVSNATDYTKELERVFHAVHSSKHLAGFCFTQLTDVEQEINGLLSYDRKPKIAIEKIRAIITNKFN